MAIGISAALANSQLDAELGTVYVQLHTGDPGASGTAHIASTTRQQATFTTASGGVASLATPISWVNWSDDAATITHVTTWSASSSGSFKRSGALVTPTAVVNGGTFQLATATVSYPQLAA